MSVFMNLIRGNTLANHVGVKGDGHKFGKDYSYIECQGKDLGMVSDGDFVVLKPSISVDPKKCKLLVVPNFKLAAVGSLSYQSIIEAGEGDALGFSLRAARDFDLSSLDYLCRIYAIYS